MASYARSSTSDGTDEEEEWCHYDLDLKEVKFDDSVDEVDDTQHQDTNIKDAADKLREKLEFRQYQQHDDKPYDTALQSGEVSMEKQGTKAFIIMFQ